MEKTHTQETNKKKMANEINKSNILRNIGYTHEIISSGFISADNDFIDNEIGPIILTFGNIPNYDDDHDYNDDELDNDQYLNQIKEGPLEDLFEEIGEFALHGSFGPLKFICVNVPERMHAYFKQDKPRALHAACCYGYFDIVKLLSKYCPTEKY